jgi:hypothetical protein
MQITIVQRGLFSAAAPVPQLAFPPMEVSLALATTVPTPLTLGCTALMVSVSFRTKFAVLRALEPSPNLNYTSACLAERGRLGSVCGRTNGGF